MQSRVLTKDRELTEARQQLREKVGTVCLWGEWHSMSHVMIM